MEGKETASLGRARNAELSSPPQWQGTTGCGARPRPVNQMSHNQNPVLKLPTHKNLRNSEGGRSYLWLGLSLTNLYLPGF